MKKCIIINASNYPFGWASVKKVKLMADGLFYHGYDPYVLNMFSNLPDEMAKKISYIGKANHSVFIYTSKTTRKLKTIKKLLLVIPFLIRESFILKRILNNTNEKVIILQYTNPLLVLWYRMISRLLKAKLFIHSMEYHVAIKSSISSRFFDHKSYKYSDGVIVISQFLRDLVQKSFPQKPTMILPVTVDYEQFVHSPSKAENYFLFCASAGHIRVFEFVIEAFRSIHYDEKELVLVCNGSKKQMKDLSELITSLGLQNKIKIFSGLPYSELVNLYQNAKVLLIPLFDDDRDWARFPHKIGEYTAARRPILTTPVGEAMRYFDRDVDILISEDASTTSFGKKMHDVLTNIDEKELSEMGLRGYQKGYQHFNHLAQGRRLVNFFEQK